MLGGLCNRVGVSQGLPARQPGWGCSAAPAATTDDFNCSGAVLSSDVQRLALMFQEDDELSKY